MDLIKEYWVKYTTHLKSHFQLIPPFVLDEIAALLILQMRFNERSLMHLDVLISLNIHLWNNLLLLLHSYIIHFQKFCYDDVSYV